jgi:uracil-DNA glycosylase family 4
MKRYHDQALLVLGEAPGFNEDQEGRPFVGKAGKMLRELYMGYYGFPDRLDVYLSNSVQCRPPQNTDPSLVQKRACQGYWLAALRQLQEAYDGVIVFCLGRHATESALGLSLKNAFSVQGETLSFSTLYDKVSTKTKPGKVLRETMDEIRSGPFPDPCPVFATYHPSALFYDGSRAPSVEHHLNLLDKYLKGDTSLSFEASEVEYTVASPPPSYSISRVSLDIETYGCLKDGPDQTQFHPVKSEHWDKVNKRKMIVSTSVSWYDPEGVVRSVFFRIQDRKHRRILWTWLKKFRDDPGFEMLLCQNIAFDLGYLRYCYPECKGWLDHPLPIMDLMVTNYLHDEGRPERSLKNLAPLFQVTKYSHSCAKAYTGDRDPDLARYNCQDSAATLVLQGKLEGMIRDFYGKDTKKLSPFCYRWYSEILWAMIWMTECGVALDRDYLEGLLHHYLKRWDRLLHVGEDHVVTRFRGTGSRKDELVMMQEALDTLVERGVPEPELDLTKKRKEVSSSKLNRKALLDVLPRDTLAYARLHLYGRYQKITKVLDSYLFPILKGSGKTHKKKGATLVKGLVYPRWWAVPSEWAEEGEKESSEKTKTGGTKQGRLVASGPAVATFPPIIQAAIRCRFPGGTLPKVDYSQLELRIAALLSNDEAMVRAYTTGEDLHLQTAKMIFGEGIMVLRPAEIKKFRRAGKIINFLTIYWGGAQAYKDTLMREVGFDRSLFDCQVDLAKYWEGHKGLRDWGNETIKFVLRHGYFELPLIGQSRLFPGGKRAVDMNTNDIVNMPIQCIAAQVMLSAQFHLQWELKKAHARSLVPMNVYDGAPIEVAPKEEYLVNKLIEDIFPNPPYYQALCEELGRTVPLVVDKETLQ